MCVHVHVCLCVCVSGSVLLCLSICLSITRQYCLRIAKLRMMQAVLHDKSSFLMPEILNMRECVRMWPSLSWICRLK